MGSSFFISKNSLVNEYVDVGRGSSIWHFCNIFGSEDSLVRIGRDTQIGSYCEIMPGVKIGNGCKIEPYVFLPERTSIGNYVFVGPGTKFLNDKYPSALKPSVRRWEPSPATIEDKVSIGGGVIIGPGITIGTRSVIGAGAVLTKDVNPYSVVIKHNEVIGDLRDNMYNDKYVELLK